METKNYAVIDIGSNTMRLVLFNQGKNGRLQEVENVKAVTRLRNYLNSNNQLTDEGINILIATLKSFKEVLTNYKTEKIICAATATIRSAENQERIESIVKAEVGWDIQILSGKEEAYYGYLAVVNSTNITEGITVDLGGASTEITYFKDRILVDSYSFPFGALTLKNLYSKHNSLTKLKQYIYEQLKTQPWIKNKNVPVIAIGGSARNLAQIDQNMKNYPLGGLHQYMMTGKDIEYLVQTFSRMSVDQIQKLEGLSRDRSDIILPATIALQCLYSEIDGQCFILSRKGLREGLIDEHLYAEYENNLTPSVLDDSILELAEDYNLNKSRINHVISLTKMFFEHLLKLDITPLATNDWNLLDKGCKVFSLGQYIDTESSSQHTFYLLANRTINGLMHKNRLKLALVASFKNKTLFKQYMKPFKNWFTEEEQDKLYLLGAILKFTYGLDATKRHVVHHLSLKLEEKKLIIDLYCAGETLPEEYQAEKNTKHLEKALKRDIELNFIKQHSKNNEV